MSGRNYENLFTMSGDKGNCNAWKKETGTQKIIEDEIRYKKNYCIILEQYPINSAIRKVKCDLGKTERELKLKTLLNEEKGWRYGVYLAYEIRNGRPMKM